MSRYWNDDERAPSGTMSARTSIIEVKEQYISISDVIKELYMEQKEKQYSSYSPVYKRTSVFAKSPPLPKLNNVIEVVAQNNEEDEDPEQEINSSILENQMYKKSWYS